MSPIAGNPYPAPIDEPRDPPPTYDDTIFATCFSKDTRSNSEQPILSMSTITTMHIVSTDTHKNFSFNKLKSECRELVIRICIKTKKFKTFFSRSSV